MTAGPGSRRRISTPRMVPVKVANLSASNPMRWSMETNAGLLPVCVAPSRKVGFTAGVKWLLPACAVFLILACPRALAWSAPGHMIVTALAYDQLSREERDKLDLILSEHVKYPSWKTQYPEASLPGLTLPKFIAMLASLYPDDIRNHDNPETFPEWHYIDYPLHPPDFPMLPGPTPGNDLLVGLARSANAVVKLTSKYDKRARATMLSFLLHLVGDAHQPLHCETLFNDDFKEPDGDRGGNNAWVKAPGGPAIKLHAFWDRLFGPGPALYRPPPLTMVLAALHEAQQLAPAFPRASLPELTAHPTPERWTLESRELVIKEVWLRGTLAYGTTEGTAGELTADYAEKALEIAKRQVALAGHRLADQLHQVLE